MASQEPPLDEIQWRSPQYAQFFGGIHSDTVLLYFATSAFNDPTSNNQILISQAQYNPNLNAVVASREAFEARLKTMSGLEFMVAHAPAETGLGQGTGVWVIRKQTRRKRAGQEDELTVHSTYYVMGENVYMAATVADVMANRMLTAITSLNKFVSSASALPNFSPALGHTYMPPASANRLKSPETQISQASKENTPLPDSLPSARKALPSTRANTLFGNQLIKETLDITMKYGDEYMDENLVTGQPGDFHLSTAGRKEKDKLMVPAKPPALQAIKPAPPPPLKTDVPAAKKNKGDKSPKTPGSAAPKLKRRKSKPLTLGAASPA